MSYIEVDECIETPEGRGGDSRHIPDHRGVAGFYGRTFRIRTNDEQAGPCIVLFAARQLFDVYVGAFYANGLESDIGSSVTNIRADQASIDGLSWLVTVAYEPLEDPLAVPRQVHWDHQPYEKIAEKDTDGRPV